MSSILRFCMFISSVLAVFIFLFLRQYFVFIPSFFVTCVAIFAFGKVFEKWALKRYQTTINTLKDIIENKQTNSDTFLPEFESIIINLKSLLEDSTETLQQAKHRQSTISKILDTTEDGLLLLDKNYKIVMANKAGLGIFNIKRIRKRYTFMQLYRNEKMTQALKNLNQTNTNIIDIKRGCKTYRIHLNCAAGGYTIFTKDVSDIIRMEQMQKEFSANVSHALKTPLTSISGFAELLYLGMVTDPKKIAHHSHKIYTQTQRLIMLVDDILRLDHLDETETTQKERLKVQDIVTNAIDILSQKIEEKNLNITVTGVGMAPIKYSHMVELVTNLLDNAIKYNKHGGHIDIFINETENKLLLSVKDTGIGIDRDKLPFIFERFYRIPSTTQGNGLGLSIVDTIVKLYKGKIDVESVKGIGTTFIVELDIAV